MERLREALRTARHHRRRTSTLTVADAVPGRRRAAGPGRATFRARRPTRSQANFDRNPRAGRHLHVHDEAEHRARPARARRWCRRGRRSSAASTSSASPSRASRSRPQGDQILVQLPGVTDVERAKEIIRSTGLLELKIVEQGPAPTKEALLQSTAQVPDGHGDRARRRRSPATPATRLLPGAQGRRRHRPGPAQRAAVARREQPAGGQLHADSRRRAQVRQASPARTSAATWRSSSTAACSRRRASKGGSPTDGRITGSFTHGRGAEPVADAAVRRAAGDADLPRGARRSARRSAPTRSAPASSRRSSACC